jgi:hypothetical protein
VGGGCLLLISSLAMLNAQPAESKPGDVSDGQAKVDAGASIAVVPLTIPLLTGPATISTMVIYAEKTRHLWQLGVLVGYGVRDDGPPARRRRREAPVAVVAPQAHEEEQAPALARSHRRQSQNGETAVMRSVCVPSPSFSKKEGRTKRPSYREERPDQSRRTDEEAAGFIDAASCV